MIHSVQNNIPVKNITYKYPFHTLQVGESFVFAEVYSTALAMKAGSMCANRGGQLNRKFRSGNDQGCVRVWRVK